MLPESAAVAEASRDAGLAAAGKVKKRDNLLTKGRFFS